MRILVCGVNGFVGHHLVIALKSGQHEILATGMDDDLASELTSYVSRYYGKTDLTDTNAVRKLPLDTVDAVINLAGLAQVGSSYGAKEKYSKINVGVHTTIADELLLKDLRKVRIIAVSTGAVYDSAQPMPLTEESKLATQASPYALSKIAMEQAMQERRKQGLDVIIVRPFNHIGPGQLPGFLVPDLVTQLKAGSTVRAGDLTTERDYTDVRDVARAYVLLATSPKLHHSIYNVCSGTSTSGQSMLDEVARAMGKNDVSVEVDESLIRPNDPRKIFGSNQKIHDDTGWQPQISLEQTIHDIVES